MHWTACSRRNTRALVDQALPRSIARSDQDRATERTIHLSPYLFRFRLGPFGSGGGAGVGVGLGENAGLGVGEGVGVGGGVQVRLISSTCQTVIPREMFISTAAVMFG